MPSKRSRKPSKGTRGDDPKAELDRPPLGPNAERAEPLEGRAPAMQRAYDPGFTPPDDSDPWRDEGHPESSG